MERELARIFSFILFKLKKKEERLEQGWAN